MSTLNDFQLKSEQEYLEAYRKSIEQPAQFWGDIAATFRWKSPWEEVLRYDWTQPKTEWFIGGN